jgi:WD40 repeat protein
MVRRPGGGLGLPALVLLALAALAQPASAQYFGRQKVQYEHLDWQTLKTPHFLIHYYPVEKEITKDAARMAERWYQRHENTFQHEFTEKPLIFYADHPDFQQTNVIGGLISEGTGGVTEGLRTRVIMPYTGVYADNDHVLGHELVHVFQYDLAASPVGGGLQGFSRLPLWLVEGMAEYLSLGRSDPHTAMWMRDAALRGELPTIQQLTTDTRFFPYRYGQGLWAYIGGRWGDRAVTEVFRISTNVGFEEALVRVLGVNSTQLSQDWITAIRAQYLPLIEGRQRPQDIGKPILYDPEAGAMNLSPAVSPDGKTVAFFGRRDLFTVDLLLADAETGKIVKRLSSPQRDQHIDAISFIQSSGGWSPDGTKFAYVVFKGGDSQMQILDVKSTNVEKTYDFDQKGNQVGAVSDPRWSPDGRQIVFSGMSGGLSDLYVLDVATGDVDQLTNDKYADLQPAWSPDGRTIAWVTDRKGTDLEKLTYGPMQIALMDMTNRQFRVLDGFDGAKHIDPQWSPDGRDLYFIADHEGFSDVYRMNVETGQLFQVTKLATGVSGITALSPAISVSSQTGLLMFSAFENSGNNIYSLDCATACGTPVDRVAEVHNAPAGILPPMAAAGGGVVAQYLDNPEDGLPPSTVEYPTKGYKPKIGLEYLGPPSFGVGVSNYGTGVAGGVSAFFGDMLGDHFLGAVIQANGTLKDIGGQALYRNASRRLNWGFGLGHLPYLTGYQSYTPVDATTYQVSQILQRIYVDQLSAITYYPLSQTRRFELNAGLTRYAFNTEVQSAYFNSFGQQLSNVERTTGQSPDPLYFFESSVAFVGDNSNFAFVSPISGKRFRFEVAPTFGTLDYQTLLMDYRSYKFMSPFTLAFRAMHYGRYGKNSDGIRSDGTQVLQPLFLGYETFIRGYDYGSFQLDECGTSSAQTTSNGCPVFDRLLGTRIAVANLELRVPLFGVHEYGLLNFPFLPTEIAPFLDAGMAWSAGDSPDLTFARNTDKRVPVFSAGITARVNILGFMVLETYYAYPFQRPGKGAHIGFNLAPGW